MKYMNKRRHNIDEFHDEDPMSGIANLFDVGLVFIVALLISLFSAYRLQDLFDENSEMTIVKRKKNGEMEIITKKGKKIEARKMTKKQAEGKGEKLGMAYKLEDGSVIYIPADKK